jgi:hypothetical protein
MGQQNRAPVDGLSWFIPIFCLGFDHPPYVKRQVTQVTVRAESRAQMDATEESGPTKHELI